MYWSFALARDCSACTTSTLSVTPELKRSFERARFSFASSTFCFATVTCSLAALRLRKAVRGQIDYDVRTAFLNLNAAKEQVTVAKQNVELANENLARSKDRFSSGVTDSVEVVRAEQSLASANDQFITSLYDHNLAKLSLARALGVARTNYSQYLVGK